MASPVQPIAVPQSDGININMISDIIGWVGTIVAIALNFTPAVLFYNIIKKGQTIKIIPESMLVFNILCSMLWYSYWFQQSVFVPCFCSIVCNILSVCFSIIYAYLISEGNIWKWLFYTFIIVDLTFQIFYIFAYLIPYPKTGFIAMLVNILTYATPGQKLYEVIKKGDHNMIPIVTVLFGTACSISWLIFGLLKMDMNCIMTNSIGLGLSTINIIV